MSCAEFERDVARLMAEEVAEELRPALLRELRRHAAGCDDCRGTHALLDLISLPRGERDLADDPGPAYWSGFGERVRQRIGRGAEARQPRWSRRVWAAAAVAVVALAALGLWLVRPDRGAARPDDPGVTVADGGVEDPAASGPAGAEESVADPELDALAEMLVRLDDESWEAGLDDAGDGGLFPETEQLDAETRRKFLEWLEEQNSGGRGVSS